MDSRKALEAGIPLPVVTLTRWLLLLGVTGGLVFRQPLATTALLVLLLPGLLFGPRANALLQLGRLLPARRLAEAEKEDPRLMRFNNGLAALLLTGAQICFLSNAAPIGWTLALLVAAAAAAALAGYCMGCFLYYRFKIGRAGLGKRGH